MNLSLLDPFILAQDCPEAVTGDVRSGHSAVIRFSHRGDFLASGRTDGTVVIFDIDTHGVARLLKGHVRQIGSLSWSQNDRYLLSGSHDWKVILWDLSDGSKVRVIRFDSAIFVAELHPTNHLLFLVAAHESSPHLVDISSEDSTTRLPFPSAPLRPQEQTDGINGLTSAKHDKEDEKAATVWAQFTPGGTHVLSGTNKGWLNVISTANQKVLYSIRLTPNIIYLVRMTQSGRGVLTNSSDRIIRTITLPDLDDPAIQWENLHLEIQHRYQDLVNRLSWNHATFSSNGEYVAASTFMNHEVYVWERTHGSLVKILEGPREELSSLDWHPHKPFIAAAGSETGRIYFWSIHMPQRWSALAPDFAEVEENVEHVEREDEFDIQPLEEVQKRRLDQEDEEVDVLTVEPVKGAEWAEPGEFRMPVLLDIEDEGDSEDEVVAVGAGQFRKKTTAAGAEDALVDEAATQGVGGAGQAANGTSKRRRRE